MPTTTTRHIPSDEELITALRRLKGSRAWTTIFARLLCYGLRPHEAFLCTISKDGICHVPTCTKTGERVVPLIPDLLPQIDADLPALCHGPLPSVTASENRVYGMRTCQCFKRFDIPFRPYDLRHRWVVLSEECSIPPAIAAVFCGHSIRTRYAVYTRTLDSRRAMVFAQARGWVSSESP
jgi:integrase